LPNWEADITDLNTYLFINSAKFWGGGEQWFLQCARELARRGHRVTVAGRRDGIFLQQIGEAGLHTLPLSLAADFAPLDMLRLRRWLIVHEPQAVLCNFTRDVRLAGRTLHHTHGIYSVLFWVMGSILLKDTRRHRQLVTRYVDHFIVPSESLKTELLAFSYVNRPTVEVLPIGLDLRQWPDPSPEDVATVRRQCGITDDRMIVGAFARLEPRKGHHSLLLAWETVHHHFPDAELWLVGAGSAEREWRELVRSRDIRGVKFMGFVKNVREVMPACDIVVQPSLYEPFGITLLEAMACAKPVVCTRVGGMPEVVAENETAFLVPPDAPAALAGAVLELMNNPTCRTGFGRAGRGRVEELFTLARMADRLEEMLVYLKP
jgi:glycosyltransferase involved in cell wall biosynthesis